MSAVHQELNFPPPASLHDEEFQAETRYERASRTIVHPADATIQDQMNIVESSGALAFWSDPAEGIYCENDGDAV